jgi:hypothetical protein
MGSTKDANGTPAQGAPAAPPKGERLTPDNPPGAKSPGAEPATGSGLRDFFAKLFTLGRKF